MLVENSIRDFVSQALVRFKGCGDVLAWALDDHLWNASCVPDVRLVIGFVQIYRAGMNYELSVVLSNFWCFLVDCVEIPSGVLRASCMFHMGLCWKLVKGLFCLEIISLTS